MDALLIILALIFSALVGASIVAAFWLSSTKRNQPYKPTGFGISESFYNDAMKRLRANGGV